MARTADRTEQAERISQAVWRIMAEGGPQGLTLRAVAAAAGCTTGLVLHRFPDKRALLLHARDLLHERTGRQMDEREAEGGPPSEVLRAILGYAASVDPAKRQEARVWLGYLTASLADPDLAARHVTANRAFLARIGQLVAAARPGWDERPRTEVATALVALVEGVNTLAAADSRTYSPATQHALIDRALDAFGLT
ncbi:TetR family transcriptional regulator [Amycolatopsis acidiphila]|uniref:TetR family transcriptional regulator n=1 Tax=Amycolatopsis acidiphila TaxID=715473 RepID=A0A557ZY40_9PSEU|nr:TetR/AcrR family transcriptional regulator [Amycolatopsis acidiphila]TVT16926.1 TetR family transcriptional regulator [Amycolatopsis acidiphila]UIJ62095.1 TetR family transcriptional regulator [Amycolatopsis acidiphila]GHG91854.1 TetR family transcriptional regulator [Amycolatopsis acidiphila]